MPHARPRPMLQRYGLAALVSGLALLLAWSLRPLIEPIFFPLFYIAVVVSAWYGGLGPGVFVTLVGVAAHTYFFLLNPALALDLPGLLARLSVFMLTMLVVGSLTIALARAVAGLTENQRRLQALFDHAQDAFLLMDDQGRFVDTNLAACALLGYSREQLMRLRAEDLTPGTSRELEGNLWQELMASGAQCGEHALRRRDGTTVEVEYHAVAHIIPGVHLAVVNDIAARKRAEGTLHFLAEAGKVLTSSLDYEATLQHVARLAVPILADFCFVNMVKDDQLLEPIAAAAADPAKEEPAREARRHFRSDVSRMQYLRAAVDTGRPVLVPEVTDALLRAVARDAVHLKLLRELGFVSLMIVPLVARGHTLGAMVFFTAQSGRRYTPADQAVAEELARRAAIAIDNARLYQEAQAAVRARDAFLAVASHEVKTPLATIKGYAELLQRHAAHDGAVDERDQRAVRSIYEQSVRLHKLIELLFDVSRLQSGHLSIQRARVDLNALVRRLVEALRPTLQQHSLDFCSTDEPLIVTGDEVRLEQVVQNLLSNAIKYSPEGGLVCVSLQRRGNWGRLTISDPGIGIPQEALPRLFSPFYRGTHSAVRGINGAGLGLYIAKEILTFHGGTIDVDSTEGKGSTFTVSLPVLAGDDEK